MEEKQKPIPHISWYHHLLLFVLVLMVLSFVVWARVCKIDIVSLARGKVVPASRVKKVQHLEGGIVRKILVKEGEKIHRGEKLIVLEEVQSKTNINELNIEMASLQVEIARLKAEIQDFRTPEFSPFLKEHYPEFVRHSMEIFNIRREKFLNEVAGAKQAVVEKEQEIKEIRARLNKNITDLSLLKKQVKISSELLKSKLTSEYKHLNLLRQETKLQGEIRALKAALIRSKAALKRSLEEVNRIYYQHKQMALTELKNALKRLEELKERKKRFTDTYKRTIIRSPVNGVVKRIYVTTEGEVIQPGETLLEIVPSQDRLIIEAYLPMKDIIYVKPGQDAMIKLSSRDARRFGYIKGKVISISPDAFQTENGQTFYIARVETKKTYFEWEGHRYYLFPGMILLVYIRTGKRSLLEYLLDPYMEKIAHAFSER